MATVGSEHVNRHRGTGIDDAGSTWRQAVRRDQAEPAIDTEHRRRRVAARHAALRGARADELGPQAEVRLRPAAQQARERAAGHVGDDDALGALPLGGEFRLPFGEVLGPGGRRTMMTDGTGRTHDGAVEPGPLHACVADVEQQDHEASLNDTSPASTRSEPAPKSTSSAPSGAMPAATPGRAVPVDSTMTARPARLSCRFQSA